ncbi:MAG TPA: LPS export ABC transporter permease LptF [Afifellaceae bacterium]|nr:LPS export ABC transporter permease LptF [Afifellaceae bacterium]
MPLLERYVLRRITHAFVLTLCVLVATLWVTQVLRQLDVVTAKGQTIGLFLAMTALAIPAIIQNIAPVAFLVATLMVLNQLNNDSEMAVMHASGASRRVVARPLLVFAVALTLALMALHHLIAPASLGSLRELVTRARADLLATIVKDGDFRTVEDGLTVHIREKAADGSFRGIFVSDSRGVEEHLRYVAEQGLLVESAGKSFLLLSDGELIRETGTEGTISVVAFKTYAFDLSQFRSAQVDQYYKPRERLTGYLIAPDSDDKFVNAFPTRVAAELHDRVTAPLYVLVFAIVVLVFGASPRTNRQDRGYATVVAVIACVALRGGGFAAVAAVNSNAAWVPLLYVLPLAGMAVGWAAFVSPARIGIPPALVAALDAVVERAVALAGRMGWPVPAPAAEQPR